MNMLKPIEADKLARICGMFGSEHEGERASAAWLADRLVRGAGVSWFDVLAGANVRSAPESLSDLCRQLLAYSDFLTVWEASFLQSLRAPITPRQRDKLDDIAAKVRKRREGQP
jgi:hypothetical protein